MNGQVAEPTGAGHDRTTKATRDVHDDVRSDLELLVFDGDAARPGDADDQDVDGVVSVIVDVVTGLENDEVCVEIGRGREGPVHAVSLSHERGEVHPVRRGNISTHR